MHIWAKTPPPTIPHIPETIRSSAKATKGDTLHTNTSMDVSELLLRLHTGPRVVPA
jgi:hypothetical protein